MEPLSSLVVDSAQRDVSPSRSPAAGPPPTFSHYHPAPGSLPIASGAPSDPASRSNMAAAATLPPAPHPQFVDRTPRLSSASSMMPERRHSRSPPPRQAMRYDEVPRSQPPTSVRYEPYSIQDRGDRRQASDDRVAYPPSNDPDRSSRPMPISRVSAGPGRGDVRQMSGPTPSIQLPSLRSISASSSPSIRPSPSLPTPASGNPYEHPSYDAHYYPHQTRPAASPSMPPIPTSHFPTPPISAQYSPQTRFPPEHGYPRPTHPAPSRSSSGYGSYESHPHQAARKMHPPSQQPGRPPSPHRFVKYERDASPPLHKRYDDPRYYAAEGSRARAPEAGDPYGAYGGRGSRLSPGESALGMDMGDTKDQGLGQNRRLAHLMSEQKRRESINTGFTALRSVLPSALPTDSKAIILRKALSRIQQLERVAGIAPHTNTLISDLDPSEMLPPSSRPDWRTNSLRPDDRYPMGTLSRSSSSSHQRLVDEPGHIGPERERGDRRERVDRGDPREGPRERSMSGSSRPSGGYYDEYHRRDPAYAYEYDRRGPPPPAHHARQSRPPLPPNSDRYPEDWERREYDEGRHPRQAYERHYDDSHGPKTEQSRRTAQEQASPPGPPPLVAYSDPRADSSPTRRRWVQGSEEVVVLDDEGPEEPAQEEDEQMGSEAGSPNSAELERSSRSAVESEELGLLAPAAVQEEEAERGEAGAKEEGGEEDV